jgi:serine protease
MTVRSLLAAFLAAVLFPIPVQAQRTAPPDAPTDRLIVKWKKGAFTEARLARLSERAGVRLARHRAMSGGAEVLKLDRRRARAEARALAARLAQDPEVEYAVADEKRFPFAAPNDGYFTTGLQSNLTRINVHRAWDITTGNPSLVVAVVDTGILPHPDLDPARMLAGRDFVTESYAANDGDARDVSAADPGDWVSWADVEDPASPFDSACLYGGVYDTYSSWHGTHMAGIIGAATNNGAGIAGINWNSKILPVRVLGKCGGYDSDIIDGMRWAAGVVVDGVVNLTPAKVLNLSLGGPGACNAAWQSAIDHVTGLGKVVVVAAGNEGIDFADVSPASCQGVVTVGAFAVDAFGNSIRSFYSNFATGPAPNLFVAPGNNIYSTSDGGAHGPLNDGAIWNEYGTSGAAAHVSGIVSLMLSANPALTGAEVLQILRDSSVALGEWAGSGRIDALQAVGNALAFHGGAPVPVSVTINGPSEIFEHVVGGYSYTATVTWSDSAVTQVYPRWSMTAPFAPLSAIGDTGILPEFSVSSDQSLTVHASFTANGVAVNADKAVSVLDNYIVSLQVTGPDEVFIGSASPSKFSATGTWRDGRIAPADVAWSVFLGSGTISAAGLFRGAGAGPATIRATSGSVTGDALTNVVAGSGTPGSIAWNCASEPVSGLTLDQLHVLDVGASADIIPLCNGQVVVADRAAKRIDVIDAVAGSIVRSWSVDPRTPYRMELASGSSQIFVTFTGSGEGMASIDLANPENAPVQIPVANYTGQLASGPDGEMWVLHSQFDFFPQTWVKLSRFRVSDGTLIQTHDLPRAGGFMQYSKSQRILATADATSGGVRTAYDVPNVPLGDSFVLVEREHLSDGGGVLTALSPDGTRLLLNGRDLEVANLRFSRGVWAGAGAGGFSPDGRTLFTSDTASSTVDLVLYSVESHAPLKRWPKEGDCTTGSLIQSARFSPTGAFAFAVVICGFSPADQYSRLFWIPLGSQPTPDVIRFEAQNGVAPGALATSNAVAVEGFGTATISVTGGEYSLDGGGFTAATGTVSAGQTVQVRAQAPAGAYATSSATLTIGHLSVPFFVTTGAAPPAGWWNPSCASEADLGAAAVQYFDIEATSDIVALCDGRLLVGNRKLNRVELLDVRARGVVDAWPLTAAPELLRLVPGTSLLLVLTDSSSITKLDLATGAQSEIAVGGRPFDVTPGESGEIMVASQASPTANTFNGDTFTVHDLSSGAELERQSLGFDWISRLRYYPGDHVLITGDAFHSPGRLARYSYDPVGRAITLVQQTIETQSGTSELVIAPDRSRLAYVLGGLPSSVAEWNPNDFGSQPVGNWLSGAFPRAADFRGDGAKLLIGLEPDLTATKGMSIFDVATRAGEKHWALPHCERSFAKMRRVRFSPSGAYAFALEHCDPMVTTDPVRGRVFWISTAAPGSVPVPDPVTFAPQVNVPLNADIASNFVLISGLKGLAVPISVSGGQYQFLGEFPTGANGMVQDGNRVRLINTSSFAEGVATTTTLNIGGTLLHFSVTTGNGGADTTPDPFRLFVLKNRPLDIEFVSNTVVVTGIDAPAPISVAGGAYSIDGGAFTSAAGTVSNGQLVTVKLTSANAINTASSAILTVGGFSTSLSVTTGATDTTPDVFAFAPRPRVPRNRWIESNPVTIAGLAGPVTVSIEGGEYRIGAGAYTPASGTVSNGEVVHVRVMSGATLGETAVASLTVGPRSATFSVMTGAAQRTDLSADGRSDILWRNTVTGENYMYFMNGASIVNEGYLRTVPQPDWQIVGTGDFDGDGSADILWRNAVTGENYMYFMNGASIVSEGYLRTVPQPHWQIAGVGDFDGDGKDDVLWRNGSSGENYVYFMDGLSIINEGYLRTVADADWKIVGLGDLDADGKSDVLWRNAASGANYLYPMDGLAIKPSEGFIRTVDDMNWQVKGLGDLDGDGNADVVWRHVLSGQNYVYLMQGANIAGEGYLRTVEDANWQIAAVGDYDGDGKSDLLWRNSFSGENYLYPMDGATIKPSEGYLRSVPPGEWAIVGK